MHILKSGVKAKVMLALTGTCWKTGLSSPVEWTCGKSWITQATWILILLKSVCKVYDTTASHADQRMGMSQSDRRKVDGVDVWIYSPYAFKQFVRWRSTDKTESNDNLLQAAFHIKWNYSKALVISVSGISNKCLEYSNSHFSNFAQS